MGETPTYGKIEVNVPRNAPFKAVSKASSSSREGMSSSAAAVEAAIEASCSEGLDAADGHGPLDASGRPGWPFGDSGSGGVSADDGADDGSGAVLKKVEWYGTIRLLVFVRKGQHFQSMAYAPLKCDTGCSISAWDFDRFRCWSRILSSAAPPRPSVCDITQHIRQHDVRLYRNMASGENSTASSQFVVALATVNINICAGYLYYRQQF